LHRDAVRTSIAAFDHALLKRDSASLNSILHDSLSFIHSNGWKQSKADVLADAASGKLIYQSITAIDGPELSPSGDTITSTRTLAVSGLLSGKAFSLKIRVTERWKWERGSWKLVFRQSAKIP
jgi:hypothetical protein